MPDFLCVWSRKETRQEELEFIYIQHLILDSSKSSSISKGLIGQVHLGGSVCIEVIHASVWRVKANNSAGNAQHILGGQFAFKMSVLLRSHTATLNLQIN